MLAKAPEALCHMLRAVYLQSSKQPKLVIAGKPGVVTRSFLQIAAQSYHPALVVSGSKGESLSVFTKSLPMKDGKPTAYYCLGKVCKEPVTDVVKLAKMLNDN